MSSFLGMRGTNDWPANVRPENWRQMMLYLYPNGSAPLTGLMSMTGSESVNDPHFHWWTKTLPEQKVDLAGLYTDNGLSTAYAGDNLGDGDYVYAKGSLAQIQEFKPGHQVIVADASDYRVKVNGKVIKRVENGANSYLAIRLIESTSATNDLDTADVVKVVGSVNPEGGTLGEAIAYDPVEFSNYTQIMNTALSITRTARKTRLRTGDQYQEAKRECLELHSLELEKALIHGVKSSRMGDNGKPERTTDGILSFINKHASDNIDDFRLNGDFTGTWVAEGSDWIDQHLEKVYRFGNPGNKVGVVGSGALLGINKLAQAGADINIEPGETDYGTAIRNWITPFGSLPLITHPLFSNDPQYRNSLLIVDASNLKYRYIDDTFFISDADKTKNTHPYVDGTEEGYLTEWGLEFHFPQTMGMMHNIGKDN